MKKDRKQQDLKVTYVADMYRDYINREISKNPNLYKVYDKVLAVRDIHLLVKKNAKGKEETVMNYTLFRSILEKCNKLIIDTMLMGEKFYFGHSLGFIQGSRIERNFNKKYVNIRETKLLREETGDNDLVVYYTDDTYCRISWKKLRSLKNSGVYEFKPTKNFRFKFSQALMKNPMLEYMFTFYKRP